MIKSKTRWCADAKLNFYENMLRYSDERTAISFWGEDKVTRKISYNQLHDLVSQLAQYLRSIGVQKGDRVAAFIPNIPEAIIGMLATTSIGAIWSSCSPDFETQGVIDRFGQIEPKVLICADGYWYKGKQISSYERIKELQSQLKSLEQIIVVNYAEIQADYSQLPKTLSYQSAVQNFKPQSIEFEQTEAEHPVYIMYSSGTTGVPKCLAHGAIGLLLEHFKELALHTNLTREDNIFYATTCGWMMWNWLVSALGFGSTVVIYDGFPFLKNGNILFDLADQEDVSIFGTSAGFISALEKNNLTPKKTHSLSPLKTILSTGSPLVEENFDYVYSRIKSNVQLCSISGGTDIVGCFALGCPILPIVKGQLQCRSLGMDVDVFDEDGNSIRGQTGELVCKNAFPSMPIYFWNDEGGAKYHAAYFDRFENIWCHGDYAILTGTGGVKILGRSDATLNPGGVRIGTAEVYRAIERITEIEDSLVIGQNWENSERIVLFVKLKDPGNLDDQLKKRILSEMPSPRHRPAKILEVSQIPITRSGKKVEIAVRKVVHGEQPKNLAALSNPESLDEYRDRVELRS
ncbi:MAG: acetoacetate--CoA ligase [Bdellovibrionota bacterium]